MKPNKSICIYTPWMMRMGGIETHLSNMAKALSSEGWRVDLCVRHSESSADAIESLRSAGAGYHVFPSAQFFAKVLFSGSILYTNSQGNTSPLIWKHGRKGRRGFHHCHTACSAEERGSWTTRYLEFIREGVPLVACSHQTRDNLRELSPDRQVEVLPYLTSIEQPSAPVSARARSFSEGGKLDFGFIGRLEKSKGTDLIIAASKRADLTGIRWHVYGDGDQAAQVAAAQGPCLQWHGSFDRSKPLSEIYDPLDAVVLPSLHAEGSPLCLIEALSFGKPWIASGQGGIRELACSAGDHLIVDPRQPEEFFAAVKRLERRIRNSEVNEKLIRSFYGNTFSTNAVKQKWLSFLGQSWL